MINIQTVVKPPVTLGATQQMPPNQFAQPQQTPYQQQVQTQSQQTTAPHGTGHNLTRGQKVSLSKMNPNLNEIQVCLGWDVGMNTSYDLDASAFMLGADGKVVSDSHFVFYGQMISPCGSIRLSQDNKTGQGDGDDEILDITLARVPDHVKKIVFVVTIDNALSTGRNFGGVNNAFARVVDKTTNRELAYFKLTDYYADVISMMVGELYKHNGEWKFTPVGQGTKDDLAGLCTRYGVNIE